MTLYQQARLLLQKLMTRVPGPGEIQAVEEALAAVERETLERAEQAVLRMKYPCGPHNDGYELAAGKIRDLSIQVGLPQPGDNRESGNAGAPELKPADYNSGNRSESAPASNTSKACSTCGKVENPVCSNSFHLPAYQSALQAQTATAKGEHWDALLKSLAALYLEVPESVAMDVEKKVRMAMAEHGQACFKQGWETERAQAAPAVNQEMTDVFSAFWTAMIPKLTDFDEYVRWKGRIEPVLMRATLSSRPGDSKDG